MPVVLAPAAAGTGAAVVGMSAAGQAAGQSGASGAVASPPVVSAPPADDFASPNCAPIQAEAHGTEIASSAGTGGGAGGSAGSSSGGAGRAGGGGAGGGSGRAALQLAGTGGSTSGGSGGSGGGGSTSAATLDAVYEVLTCKGCSSSFCHGNAGGLPFYPSRTELYEALLGPDGQGAPSGTAAEGGACSGMKRVVPGDPDRSLLFLKVAQRQPCGAAMPPPGQDRMLSGFLNARQLEVIRSWIAAGAKKQN